MHVSLHTRPRLPAAARATSQAVPSLMPPKASLTARQVVATTYAAAAGNIASFAGGKAAVGQAGSSQRPRRDLPGFRIRPPS